MPAKICPRGFSTGSGTLGKACLAGALGAAALTLPPAAALAGAGAGALDPTFGNANVVRGQVTTAFSTEKDAIYAMALQPDGKLITVGTSGPKIALARYRPNGTLDPAFGKGGKVVTAIGKLAGGRAVALQRDGKIVVAGFNTEPRVGTSFALFRYLPDGKSDRAFGYAGAVISRISSAADTAYAVGIQPDGKIIAAGSSGSKIAVARYNGKGKLDPGFGTEGSATATVGTGLRGRALALQRDGRIVVAGTATGRTGTDFALVRFTRRGDLDPAFGKGGSTITDFGTRSDTAHGVALQPDGKIVVAGTAGTHIAAARYAANGRPDSGFGNAGRVATGVGDAAEGRALALQRDGKIVVAGFERSPDSGESVAVVRYAPTGKPDPRFGKGGIVTSDFGTPSDRGHAVVIQRDGKIVVGGRSHDPVLGDSFALVRLLGA